VLTDEELAAAQPRKTRTIDIEAFVDLDEVDPIYFDHPYVLVPRARPRARRAPIACSSR
jgi:DNA end-binding protein Ku